MYIYRENMLKFLSQKIVVRLYKIIPKRFDIQRNWYQLVAKIFQILIVHFFWHFKDIHTYIHTCTYINIFVFKQIPGGDTKCYHNFQQQQQEQNYNWLLKQCHKERSAKMHMTKNMLDTNWKWKMYSL